MTNLKNNLYLSLKVFCKTFNKFDANLGTIEYSNHPQLIEIPISVNLVDDMQTYFSHVKITDSPMIGGALTISLYSYNELDHAMEGWKWIGKAGNIRNEKWDNEWVIFGERSGDVFFCDQTSGKIYGSIQQNNSLVAHSLSQFFQMTYVFQWVETVFFDGDCRDENFGIKPGFFETLKARYAKYGVGFGNGFLEFCFE